jgi:hypothetical protein
MNSSRFFTQGLLSEKEEWENEQQKLVKKKNAFMATLQVEQHYSQPIELPK